MSNLNIFTENADAREVFSLRKTDPEAAYRLALKLITSKPTDIWIKRAYAWTIYDLTKLSILNKNYEKAKEYFDIFEGLQIPHEVDDSLVHEKFSSIKKKIVPFDEDPQKETSTEDEQIKLEKYLTEIGKQVTKEISEKLCWSFYRYLKAASESEKIDILFINRILKEYKKMSIEKPSRVHSLLFYQITHLLKNEVKGLDLIIITDCWNPPDDLSVEDFKESTRDGKRIMPFAEKFIYAYIKILLQLGDNNKIKNYLNKIDGIIANHPKYSWLPYQKCKLLIASSSDKNEILKNIIPVVKMKSSEFWTWSSLGEVLSAEPDKAISCYCKALTSKGTETFLIKVRQNLAKLLIAKKMFGEGKFEINRILEIKSKEKQRIPTELSAWMKEEWYLKTPVPTSNSAFYNHHFKLAEDLVFGDSVKSYVGVIINVDKASGKAYFSVSKIISGGFKPKKQLLLKTGDILEFKLNERNIGGQISYDVLSAEKTSKLPSKEIYREFEGTLRISKGGEIGFIDYVYVSKSLMEFGKLKNNNFVKGIAIYLLDKKRNEFGWKAIKVWKERVREVSPKVVSTDSINL